MGAWRNVRDFTPPKDGRRILAYYAAWGRGRTKAEAHCEVVWWHRDLWRMGEGEPAIAPTYWQPEPEGLTAASPASASHVRSLEWAR